jgi:hypothetical protein
MDKRPRRCRPVGMKCTRVRDKVLLELDSASKRLNPAGKGLHITEVTGNSDGACVERSRRLSVVVNPFGTLPVTGVPRRLQRK